MTGAWCYLHNGVPGTIGASCICGRFESFALRVPQPSQQRKVTDEEIAAWAARHDLQGSAIELRCIFEDAESHHLTRSSSTDGVSRTPGEPIPPTATDESAP